MHSRYVALRMTGDVQDEEETRGWLELLLLSVVMVVTESNFRRGMWRSTVRFPWALGLEHRAAWDDCSLLRYEETSETDTESLVSNSMDMKHDEPKAGARTVVVMSELLISLGSRECGGSCASWGLGSIL